MKLKVVMTKKLNRRQVSNLLLKHREKVSIKAIKEHKDIPYFEDSDEPMIWHNEYSGNQSLRINKAGLYELKTMFKIYPIPLKPGFQVKNVHIKYLEEELSYPYYLDIKKLVLFNGKDVLDIKLHDGDLDSWARARWVNDKYQEPPELPENS